MKINSRTFRLTLCAALLGASAFACSAPSATAGTTPKASVSSTPGAGVSDLKVEASPIAMATTDVTVGDGDSVEGAGAFLAAVKIWSDKFGGKPFGRGAIELLVVPDSNQMPGLVTATKGMKVGGVKNVEISAIELFGTVPAGAKIDPNSTLYMEVTAKEAFPEEEFKVETVKEGSGDKAAADGDTVKMHYVGRLDNHEDGEIFDSSRKRGKAFPVKLGEAQVIAGWEKGLQGMKKGEVRRLSIPHYLAYGVQDKGVIKPKSRLFFEVELLDFVNEGELKIDVVTEGSGTEIKSGEKGEFHYTGWLDGFDGKQKFDSSLDRNQPIPVKLGAGQVIKGWDQGLVGMKPGEVRRLTIPYNLAYGPNGRPPTIPAFATLYFEVKYVGPSK